MTTQPKIDPESRAEGASAREYGIDELAREAGTTVRNVRAYQERGLLPPPEKRGRVGIYTPEHLARLRVIARMLERGYSLGNVGELIGAWESGHDIAQLLGLEAAITSPWSDETPAVLSFQELAEMFGGQIPPEAVAKCLEMGIVQPEGTQFRVPSMQMLQIGAALSREGLPMDELLQVVGNMRRMIESAASDFVQLVVKYVFDPYGKDRLPPPEKVPQLADLVWRLRPLAIETINGEIARALEAAANRFLGDRLAQILAHMQSMRPEADASAGELGAASG
jgi:DNA-binding transcriptional MerR regulator